MCGFAGVMELVVMRDSKSRVARRGSSTLPSGTMSQFIVWGGKKLKGTYVVSGAKNAGPKLPIAALLSKEKCFFYNIPRISDTYRTIDTLTSLGCKVRFTGKNSKLKANISILLKYPLNQCPLDNLYFLSAPHLLEQAK